MQPTDEQVKEFWEWCGISKSRTGYWYYPDYCARPSAPELTLDNLFKWAVPQAIKELERLREAFPIKALLDRWYEEIMEGSSLDPKVYDYALFWAIWKAIKEQRE